MVEFKNVNVYVDDLTGEVYIIQGGEFESLNEKPADLRNVVSYDKDNPAKLTMFYFEQIEENKLKPGGIL